MLAASPQHLQNWKLPQHQEHICKEERKRTQ
jgi:hypothetical protein